MKNPNREKIFELVRFFPISFLIVSSLGVWHAFWVNSWSSLGLPIPFENTARAQEKLRIVIMLDLDDTVLKESSAEEYKTHPDVQAITYRPSSGTYSRYKERLGKPVEPGKVIHYVLQADGSMTGYVTTRPAIKKLFEKLAPYVRAGTAKVFITSANDRTRTEAMARQLKIDGRTLEQWGAEYAPIETFSLGHGIKDIALMRQNYDIPVSASVVAIDNLPDQIISHGPNDRIEPVTDWDINMSTAVLDKRTEASELLAKDKILFDGITDRIMSDLFGANCLTRQIFSGPEKKFDE